MLPDFVIPGLKLAIDKTQQYHEIDQANGITHVHMPNALAKKYPNAGKQLKWQYVFASYETSVDPITKNIGRHHIHTRSVSRAINNTVRKANIMKHVTAHVFRPLLKGMIVAPDVLSPATLVHPELHTLMV